MEGLDNFAEDVYPPNPLGCEPGEVSQIFTHRYQCPFCMRTTYRVAFEGVSTELYAVGDDGTLYRRFDPLEGTYPHCFGCQCGRGFWITTKDRFNISVIWDRLTEAEHRTPDLGRLQ